MQVNILQAKNHLSQLINALQAGEDVIIAKRGKPVARLVSISHSSLAAPGSAQSILDCLQKHPLPPYAQRSAREINATIKEERESWD